MARLIVLDASVLIAYFRDEDAHHSVVMQLLRGLAADDLRANSLTLGEVLVVPARQGRLAQAWEAINALRITEHAFPRDAADRLATLRSETGLKMPDCCVLLAAETTPDLADHGGIPFVATFDGRLADTARARGLGVLPTSDSQPPGRRRLQVEAGGALL